jgi:nitrogen fixation protein NifZ
VNPVYDYGDEVRVIRNLRNDGSFPGKDKGDLLIRRGQVGHVRNMGTFLQDQIIYTVHFVEEDLQVGCREEELQPASAPWVASRYENRDRVLSRLKLSVSGKVLVEPGARGEILKVNRNGPDEVTYDVLFSGQQILVVPESALWDLEEAIHVAE